MIPTRTALVLLATGILHCQIASADFVGINIEASDWAAPTSNTFASKSDGLSIDLVDDLGRDNPAQSSLVLILEHPITALPNIRYQGFDLNNGGSEKYDNLLSSDSQAYVSGNRVSSNLDLSHEDIVLYYQLLNNWVDLDMGLDLKRFDGAIEFSGESASKVEIDETIPLLYLSARFDLPYQGFYVGANINNLSLGNRTVEDSTIKLGYESDFGLGFEGGIKSFALELDDTNNPDADLKYDGIFLNGYYYF